MYYFSIYTIFMEYLIGVWMLASKFIISGHFTATLKAVCLIISEYGTS